MKIGAEKTVPDSACTACGHVMDRCVAIGADAGPSGGDYTVCFRCGHLMAFTDELAMRDLTDAEMYEIAGDDRLLAVQKARGAAARRGAAGTLRTDGGLPVTDEQRR